MPMFGAIALGFIAGFFAGNGLPYYVSGSFAERHVFLLGKSPIANIVAGVGAFAISITCWYFTHAHDHPWEAYPAALLGVLSVGLIHAKVWRIQDHRQSKMG